MPRIALALVEPKAVPRYRGSLCCTLRDSECIGNGKIHRVRWRRGKTAKWVADELEGPLNAWLNEGNDRAQRALHRNQTWGLENADTFSFDQDTETLTFTFPDRAVTTPFQFLGSYSSRPGTWMWAWANDSIEPRLRVDSLALREVGQLRNSRLLTERIVEISRADADCPVPGLVEARN